ncbi:hypothetical protein ACFWBF_27085 [Streptomyces sp. NPDC060028]|uniref:hypothetical protein n=1 Tax=Streptomyces sp. NPDC060028 TaxID=3347041 RepID=UPI0036A4950F
MRAPHEYSRRMSAVVAAAGAVALLTGAMMLGTAYDDMLGAGSGPAGHPAIEVPVRGTVEGDDGAGNGEAGRVVKVSLVDAPAPSWTPGSPLSRLRG